MYTYRTRLSNVPGLSAIKIRYQQLEIIDDYPHIYADIVHHILSPEEYRLSLLELVTKIRPASAPFFVSTLQITDTVFSCSATSCFRDIVRFKALEERLKAATASENAVVVTQQDLTSIRSMEDIIAVATRVCPVSNATNDVRYHPTFQYHVVEESILGVNGWEGLRKEGNLFVPIEDDDWRVTQYNNLLKQYPWISIFNPPKHLIEYGLKLLTLSAKQNGNNEMRRKMLTKALRGRTSMLSNMTPDRGHAFCIAIILIAIRIFSDQ